MITKAERAELRSLIKQRFKVLRAEVFQRKAERSARVRRPRSRRPAPTRRAALRTHLHHRPQPQPAQPGPSRWLADHRTRRRQPVRVLRPVPAARPAARPVTWSEMRRDRPDLFKRACELENLLNDRREHLGKDPVYLTRFNRPIVDAIPAAQDMLAVFGADEGPVCDNGACFT